MFCAPRRVSCRARRSSKFCRSRGAHSFFASTSACPSLLPLLVHHPSHLKDPARQEIEQGPSAMLGGQRPCQTCSCVIAHKSLCGEGGRKKKRKNCANAVHELNSAATTKLGTHQGGEEPATPTKYHHVAALRCANIPPPRFFLSPSLPPPQ